MIYVYDILINFSDNILYEFYEWNNNDVVENVKKIKLSKVEKEVFDDFLNNKVRVDKEFLLNLYKTCEVYTSRGIDILDYATLITDGVRVIAIEFNHHGISECKSKLLLEEENEILLLASNMEAEKIEYKIETKDNNIRFLTRKELKVKKYLDCEIKEAYRIKNYEKLKFLYYECFDEAESSYKTMKERFISSLQEDLTEEHLKLYNVLRNAIKKKQV